jgi:hypothetical protein
VILAAAFACAAVAVCFLTSQKPDAEPEEVIAGQKEELTQEIGTSYSRAEAALGTDDLPGSLDETSGGESGQESGENEDGESGQESGENEDGESGKKSDAWQTVLQLEAYEADWTEDQIIEEMQKRTPFLEQSSYCDDFYDYMENVRGVTDISSLFEPMFASDERFYDEEELADVPTSILKLAEYEIYARRGCVFEEEDLYCFFLGQLWYLPQISLDAFDNSLLNTYEMANLDLFEKVINDRPTVINLADGGSDTAQTKEHYFIREMSEDALVLDRIEWISDEKRAAELGLTNEIDGGFYIYNPVEERDRYEFADNCTFQIFDWYDNYTRMTVDKESFLEIVGDRGQDILDVITFIIEIRDGKIVSVEEQYQP